MNIIRDFVQNQNGIDTESELDLQIERAEALNTFLEEHRGGNLNESVES